VAVAMSIQLLKLLEVHFASASCRMSEIVVNFHRIYFVRISAAE
jgi:hypothetical protein